MTPIPDVDTINLFQAVSPRQLAQCVKDDWQSLKPDPDYQAFCYLKLSQRYAEMVARQRLVPLHGAGYVVGLVLPRKVMNAFELQSVAYEEHLEYRVPAEELEALCWYLEAGVRVVSAFLDGESYSIPCGSRSVPSLFAR